MIRRVIVLVILMAVQSFWANGQDTGSPSIRQVPMEGSDSVFVNEIVFIGNKVTKSEIILRELNFRTGDMLPRKTLRSYLEQERNKVFNTDLFVTVDMNAYPINDDSVVVAVEVLERWFFTAIPLVDFADRNFNVWWSTYNRALDRLEYGIKLNHKNFRGRREYLKFDFLFGFTKNLTFEYSIPFVDKKKTTGLSFKTSFSQNQDINFRSQDNLQDFASSEEILLRRFRTNVGVSVRSKFYNSHFFNAGFRQVQTTDSIAELNPRFLLDGRTRQRYFELSYQFVRDLRNMAAYPLKGYYTYLFAEKRGLGIYDDLNMIALTAGYSHFFDLGKNFYYATGVSGKTSYPEVQPYNQLRALGYGQQFVRGYDLYVMEGQHYGLMRNTLRWKALEGRQSISKIMPVRQFSTIPYAFYLKSHFDMGYAHNSLVTPSNEALSNKMLYGGGLGIDIVSFYDAVLRLEYSFNSIGESNFFVYYSASL